MDFVQLPENSRLSSQTTANRRRAIFLDRDGVINKDVHFLTHLEDVQILPGVSEALRGLQDDFYFIVYTNQSGIARGLIDVAKLRAIQMEISRKLAEENCLIDAYYFCPHHPQGSVAAFTIECECRKPKPGMIARAAADWNIDLMESHAVGDRVRDVQAAHAAGVKAILLTTAPPDLPFACGFAPDLRAAASIIHTQNG
jgi:D-glycero-D-manno-heptose 1,7-bisphosphate phosphatase